MKYLTVMICLPFFLIPSLVTAKTTGSTEVPPPSFSAVQEAVKAMRRGVQDGDRVNLIGINVLGKFCEIALDQEFIDISAYDIGSVASGDIGITPTNSILKEYANVAEVSTDRYNPKFAIESPRREKIRLELRYNRFDNLIDGFFDAPEAPRCHLLRKVINRTKSLFLLQAVVE